MSEQQIIAVAASQLMRIAESPDSETRGALRILATRLVAVVGCEQLDAERKRSEELVGLLRDALGMLSDLHDGKRVCFEDWVTIDGRLRAALEGR